MKDPSTLLSVVAGFRVGGQPMTVRPFGTGHINETYVSLVDTAEGPRRFVHQCLNGTVFRSPLLVMENIERVTTHIRDKLVVWGHDPSRRVLSLVPALQGGHVHSTDSGEIWRTYRFIEDATTHDVATSPNHARSVGRAFGVFQKQVGDLPGPPLHKTIPGFADTRARFEDLMAIVDADPANRAAEAKAEIDFATPRERTMSLLGELTAARQVPERIVHHDTKINNVLIDDATGEGICVIDLDTVMQGTALYDFGDMTRMGASRTAEDERDLGAVGVDLELFESLVEGYLGATREFLTRGEVDHLVDAARIVTLTIGVRFLTDFLAGDAYFKTQRQRHNLERCRVQFAMVKDMEALEDRMQAVVDRYRDA